CLAAPRASDWTPNTMGVYPFRTLHPWGAVSILSTGSGLTLAHRSSAQAKFTRCAIGVRDAAVVASLEGPSASLWVVAVAMGLIGAVRIAPTLVPLFTRKAGV